MKLDVEVRLLLFCAVVAFAAISLFLQLTNS